MFYKEGFPVSPAAAYKFYLPYILENVDKVLYLDGDIVVQDDLVELYSTDISEYFAAVVKDYHALTFKGDVWDRLGIEHRAYFNSGVMLLNLEKMRSEGISEKLVDYRLNGVNYYMDQDALNVVFRDNVLYLSFFENATLTNWRNKSSEDLSNYYEIEYCEDKYDYLRKAEIVHYCSGDKPWIYYDSHFADIWYSYFVNTKCSCQLLNRKSLKSSIENEVAYAARIQPGNTFAKNSYYRNDKFEHPLVFSVIVPVYNAEKYLAESIESVLSQSVGCFELIAVDDGSTDSSLQILEYYADQDFRMKVLQQENKYAGVARNYAMDVARGDYLFFIDADDVLAENALEQVWEVVRRHEPDVVVSGISEFHHKSDMGKGRMTWVNRGFLPRTGCFHGYDIYPFVFNFTPGGPCGKCFKRQFSEDKELRYLDLPKSEDFAYIHRGLALAEKIAVIQKPLYYKRLVPESLEHQKDKYPLAFWDGICETEKLLRKDGIYPLVRQSFINAALARFYYNYVTSQTEEAKNIILRQLCIVHKKLLCLGLYPKSYYYNECQYEYLMQELNRYYNLGLNPNE